MADVDDLRDRGDRWQRCIEARDVHGVAEFLDDDYALVLVQPARSLATRDQWLQTLPDYHEHEWRVQERVVDEVHAVQNEVSNIVGKSGVGGAAKAVSSFFHWP